MGRYFNGFEEISCWWLIIFSKTTRMEPAGEYKMQVNTKRDPSLLLHEKCHDSRIFSNSKGTPLPPNISPNKVSIKQALFEGPGHF